MKDIKLIKINKSYSILKQLSYDNQVLFQIMLKLNNYYYIPIGLKHNAFECAKYKLLNSKLKCI